MVSRSKGRELTRREFLQLAGRSAAAGIAVGATPGYAQDRARTPASQSVQPAERGAERVPVNIVVNGEARTIVVEPRMTLLEALNSMKKEARSAQRASVS